jgi:prophage regulatory protein
MENQTIKSSRVLRWPAVHQKVGLSHSQVYSLMRQTGPDGKQLFPPVIKLGQRASGWLESDVEAWIDERVKASRLSGGAK